MVDEVEIFLQKCILTLQTMSAGFSKPPIFAFFFIFWKFRVIKKITMENPFELINQRLDKIEQLLIELKANQINGNPTPAEMFMNVQQVAEYLSLSVQTIYGLTSRLEVPTIKKGKRLYFKKAEIDEWLLKGRRKTKEEIIEQAHNYLIRNKRK
jgi:excisionase family DNA binding protein